MGSEEKKEEADTRSAKIRTDVIIKEHTWVCTREPGGVVVFWEPT